jgi:hypothetical protein
MKSIAALPGAPACRAAQNRYPDDNENILGGLVQTGSRYRRAALFLCVLIVTGLAAGRAPAQQIALAAKVNTPSGPVDGPLDVKTALDMFPLIESVKTVKQLLPTWHAPKKFVVVVDRPERTSWLQQAMPAGVTVVGAPNDVAAGKDLMDADAYILASGDCTPANWQNSKTMQWAIPHPAAATNASMPRRPWPAARFCSPTARR